MTHPRRTRPQQASRPITEHQHALLQGLDSVLNTEAGLREILVHSRHHTLMEALDTVLDVDAGLAGILPAPHSPSRTTSSGATSAPPGDLRHTISPHARMTVRTHQGVIAARRDLAAAHARADDINHAITSVQEFAGAFVDPATADAKARAFSHALTLLLAGALRDARDLGQDLAADLAAGDQAAARAVADADHFARDLAEARNLVDEFGCACADDVALALTYARARADGLVLFRLGGVREALGGLLGRDLSELDEAAIEALLDDYTAADLRDADLSRTDLLGVHWSEQRTRWPEGVDIQDLKSRSQGTPPGSGVYLVVRSGRAPVRDCV
ncbi:hypothetical protein [Streptomyces sp. NPDC026673]|uniref:hypothetical protein n=1 Tax=Streptomyces sp. NPDC026673 TaxID=3155724 RepID=UPI0033FF622A